MSTFAAKAYNPTNGSTEDVWEGFSWPCFFFGCFWFLYKSMWGWAVISFFASIATYGLAWFVFPFFANEQHAKSLMRKGFLTEEQWNQKQNPVAASTDRNHSSGWESEGIADELAKLAELKNKGILTEEEFAAQKSKLLSRG